MKPVLVTVCAVAICFASCKKDNNVTPVPGNGSVFPLDSATIFQTNGESKGTQQFAFAYDAAGRLVGYNFGETDTVISSGEVDESLFVAAFVYTGADSVPSSWSQHFSAVNNPDPAGEQHSLVFSNGLLLRDSITNSGSPDYTDFTYNGNTTAAKRNDGRTDSLTYADGNLIRLRSDEDASDNEVATYSFGTLANPFYVSAWSNVAAAFITNTGLDFSSRKLLTEIVSTHNGSPDDDVFYTWNQDDAGRVISGTGTQKSSGTVVARFTFVYKKMM